MPTVERTFEVTAPPVAVLEYLKDFTHAEEWDPGTQTCVRVGPDGPVVVGTTWHNTSHFAGMTTELVYTLREASSDRIVLHGENDTAASTDTIIVTPYEGGSRVHYRAELELHGLAKLGAPVVKLAFEKLAHVTERQMVEVLDRL
jgi:carbon monoxide dehydrogenase subunit G